MEISDGLAALAAQTRQAISMEMVKKSAEADREMVSMIEQSLETIKALTSRGTQVNLIA